MGYEVTRFTHEVDEEFLCSICTMVFKDPMQSPCDHFFCNECIKGWLAVDQRCPEECGPLQFKDLKPALRIVRSLVNKFEIKCDFESKGCVAIVKLVNLPDHVGRCEYNGNAMVMCDKGCNIEMHRHQYETDNCFKHLADQVVCHQEEIEILNDEMSLQYEKIAKQNAEVVSLREEVASLRNETRRQQEDSASQMIRQNDKITTLNDEVNTQSKEIQKLNDELGRRENEITKLNDQFRRHEDEFVKLNDEICTLRSQIEQFQNEIVPKEEEEISALSNEISNASNDLVNERHQFRVWGDIKISTDQPNVLEVDNVWGSAQSVYSLEQTKFSFKIEILNLGRYIGMGLAPMCQKMTNFHSLTELFITEVTDS